MRTCENCAKYSKKTKQCKVLKECIKQDCWAWTDDKDWMKKVKEAVAQYSASKGAGDNVPQP